MYRDLTIKAKFKFIHYGSETYRLKIYKFNMLDLRLLRLSDSDLKFLMLDFIKTLEYKNAIRNLLNFGPIIEIEFNDLKIVFERFKHKIFNSV